MKKKKYLTCALTVLPLAAGLFVGSNAMAGTVDGRDIGTTAKPDRATAGPD